MRLISWNVNGIRSILRSGFWEWLRAAAPDVLCLQETRIQPEQLTEELQRPPSLEAYWHSGERKGYSGVATFSRETPLCVRFGFGQSEFDAEGRVLITVFPTMTLLNAYFPSGRRGQERVDFKIRFYDALLAFCDELRGEGRRLVVCGDYNTAHQPIDLARPKGNEKNSGFLPVEREAFGRWLERGFVDVFRRLHPDEVAYTWWTVVFDARARNIGWRIDYFLVSEELVPQVREARILGEVRGSDHSPVELVIEG